MSSNLWREQQKITDLFFLFSTDGCLAVQLDVYEHVYGTTFPHAGQKTYASVNGTSCSLFDLVKEMNSNVFIDSSTYNSFCKVFWVNNMVSWIYYRKKTHRSTIKTIVSMFTKLFPNINIQWWITYLIWINIKILCCVWIDRYTLGQKLPLQKTLHVKQVINAIKCLEIKKSCKMAFSKCQADLGSWGK